MNFHRFTQNPSDTKKLSLTPPIFHFLSLRTLQGYNGYINIYMPIIPSTPKLRRFGLVQNGVVLQILGFFFFKKEGIKKKKKKKRRRRGNRGVAGATPCPEMGWSDNPIFGQGLAEPAVWGWPKPPQAFGGGPATPIRRFGHPLAKNGVVRPPHFWARGGSSHPAIPLSFFFFQFPSFFQKKKKKTKLKPKIPKTTPFWAKRSRFGPKRRSFGVKGSLDNLPPKGS
jgi:hypothetical protein